MSYSIYIPVNGTPSATETDEIDQFTDGVLSVDATVSGTTSYDGPILAAPSGLYYTTLSSDGAPTFYRNGIPIELSPVVGAFGAEITAAAGIVYFSIVTEASSPPYAETTTLMAYTPGGALSIVDVGPFNLTFSPPNPDVPPTAAGSSLVAVENTDEVIAIDPASSVVTDLFTGTGTDDNVTSPIQAGGGYYFTNTEFSLVDGVYQEVSSYWLTNAQDGSQATQFYAPAGVTFLSLAGTLAEAVPDQMSGQSTSAQQGPLLVGVTNSGTYEILSSLDPGNTSDWETIATLPLPAETAPTQFTSVQAGDGTLFVFVAASPASEDENTASLYASNGGGGSSAVIASGNVMMSPGIATGTFRAENGTGYAATANLLYYVAGTAGNPDDILAVPPDYQLWVTDGTTAIMLRDFGANAPLDLTAAGNTVYFYVVPAGTDVNPNSGNVTVALYAASGTTVANATVTQELKSVTLSSLVAPVVTDGNVTLTGPSLVDPTISAGGYAVVQYGSVVSNPTISGGTLELSSGSGVAGDIDFGGDKGGRLVVDSLNTPANLITGFIPGDSIKLPDVNYDATDRISVTQSGVVTIVAGSETFNLNIQGATVGETNFHIGGDLLVTETAPCFCAGTRILTPRGEARVETLRPGDIVNTLFRGKAAIRWIGHRRIDCERHTTPSRVSPFRVTASAFAPGRPLRDLLLSPDHAVYCNGVLIAVRHLENTTTVAQVEAAVVEYYHIELEYHDVIYADGLACESPSEIILFLDRAFGPSSGSMPSVGMRGRSG